MRHNTGWRDPAGQSAAIDYYQLAVDVVRCGRCQKDGKWTEVLVKPDAPDRDEFAAFKELHQALIMRKDPRYDTVRLNVVPGVGQGQGAGELNHPALGAGIHIIVPLPPQAIPRCDIDDLAAPLGN